MESIAEHQGGSMTTLKKHLLDDGTYITSVELAEQTGLSLQASRVRLARTNNRERLFQPLGFGTSNKGKFKSYTLSDGSVWTIPQIVEETGCLRATIGARLHKTLDVEYVLHKKRVIVDKEAEEIEANIKERMFFDVDGFWSLFNRYV